MPRPKRWRLLPVAAACLTIAVVPLAAAQIRPATVPTIRPVVAKEVLSANFRLGQSQCAPDYSRATVPVSARVILPTSMAGTAKLAYAIHVDGASSGSATATVRRDTAGRPYFDLARTLTLRTASPETLLRLYVNGRAFGGVETVATPCRLRGAADSRAATGQPRYPDLAPGPVVVAQYVPPMPPDPPPSWPIAPVLSPGRPFGLGSAVQIENDLRRPLELWRQTLRNCPRESDAFVTVRFYISVVADGVSARDYFPHERTYFFLSGNPEKQQQAQGYYLDTRGGSPTPPTGERALPAGYEWAVFDRILPCTRSGIFEFRIDQGNRLRERDEENNILRMRYATVQPPL